MLFLDDFITWLKAVVHFTWWLFRNNLFWCSVVNFLVKFWHFCIERYWIPILFVGYWLFYAWDSCGFSDWVKLLVLSFLIKFHIQVTWIIYVLLLFHGKIWIKINRSRLRGSLVRILDPISDRRNAFAIPTWWILVLMHILFIRLNRFWPVLFWTLWNIIEHLRINSAIFELGFSFLF